MSERQGLRELAAELDQLADDLERDQAQSEVRRRGASALRVLEGGSPAE